jgi:hypothetical protein
VDQVAQLQARGAQGVILGCTEIELLIKQEHTPDTPLFASAELHIGKCVVHVLPVHCIVNPQTSLSFSLALKEELGLTSWCDMLVWCVRGWCSAAAIAKRLAEGPVEAP